MSGRRKESGEGKKGGITEENVCPEREGEEEEQRGQSESTELQLHSARLHDFYHLIFLQ